MAMTAGLTKIVGTNRDMYKTDDVNNVMGVVIAAGSMVKAGTVMVMQAAVMIDMMVGAMGTMSKSLA